MNKFITKTNLPAGKPVGVFGELWNYFLNSLVKSITPPAITAATPLTGEPYTKDSAAPINNAKKHLPIFKWLLVLYENAKLTSSFSV
ncbi:MAG: hypothetical protein ACI4WS_01685 [Oscillospiraceae bacterium]